MNITRKAGRLTAVVLSIAVLAFFSLLVRDQFWLNLAVLACIYSIMCAGLSLVFGYAGQLSFGQGGFFAIGAYVSALLAMDGGLNPWITMLVGAVAAAVAGYALGRPIVRLRGLSMAMATLASGQIIFVLARQLEITGGPIGLAGIPPLSIAGVDIVDPRHFLWLAVPLAVLAFVLSANIVKASPGRALVAIGSSERAASASGINLASYKARAFGYSAGMAGLAGALYAHYFSFVSAETFGLQLSILPVAMLVVGGLHSIRGAVVGALLVTVLQTYLQAHGSYSQLIYGAVLVLSFMFAPRGVVGLFEYAGSRYRERVPDAEKARATA